MDSLTALTCLLGQEYEKLKTDLILYAVKSDQINLIQVNEQKQIQNSSLTLCLNMINLAAQCITWLELLQCHRENAAKV